MQIWQVILKNIEAIRTAGPFDLSKEERAATPGQAHLYQANLIPKHTGIGGQCYRYLLPGREKLMQEGMVKSLGSNVGILHKVALGNNELTQLLLDLKMEKGRKHSDALWLWKT